MHDPSSLAALEVVTSSLAYLRENLEDDSLSLTLLSARADLNEFQMIRLFKALTGVTPAKFLFAMRMDTAKRLLLETDRSVTDICFDVGYNSLGTFISRFTSTVGVSPGKFRGFRDEDPTRLFTLLDHLLQAGGRDHAEGLTGEVHAPSGFSGLVFVGCFSSCIPEARPQGCAITFNDATFSLPFKSIGGKQKIFAAGVPWHNMEKTFLQAEGYWRARARTKDGRIEIALRPAEQLDPPIVTYLPALVSGWELECKRRTTRN